MFRITMLAAATALSTSVAFAAMSDRPEMLPGNTSNSSAAEITTKLQDLGYKQVQDVRLSGDVYTASAFWGDEAVSIHIDRELGEIENRLSPDVQTVHVTDNMSPSEFASSLEAIGFTNVHEVTRSGNVFRATADKDGETHRLRVDAEKGVVTGYDERSSLAIENVSGMNPGEIENALRDLGVKDPEYVAKHGQMIAAKGMWKGEPVHIDIDTESGIVDIAGRQTL